MKRCSDAATGLWRLHAGPGHWRKKSSRSGSSVIIVKPGPFRTEFLGRSINAAAAELPAYAETAGKTRAYRNTNKRPAGR